MLSLIRAQYIEINLIGIAILCFMYFFLIRLKHSSNHISGKYFFKMLICNIIILAADTFMFVMRWFSSPVHIVLNHIACVLFFVLNVHFIYYWLLYTYYRLYPNRTITGKQNMILLIPSLLNLVMTVSSPWTGIIYQLTDTNQYVRGDYLYFSTALSMIYWFASIAIVIRERIHPIVIRERNLYLTLLLAPLPTFLGDLIQMAYYGLSVIWICSALSLLVLFINLQSSEISRDMLTGLFNRRQTNIQIEWEINHLRSSNCLTFFIMIDLDYFKRINDTYGHLEGDNALISVGQILHKGFREKDFIGRYGGDEFIVIGHVNDEEHFHHLLESFHHVLHEFNEKQETYKISLSTGHRLYSKKDNLTVDSVISSIDKEMYLVKKARRG